MDSNLRSTCSVKSPSSPWCDAMDSPDRAAQGAEGSRRISIRPIVARSADATFSRCTGRVPTSLARQALDCATFRLICSGRARVASCHAWFWLAEISQLNTGCSRVGPRRAGGTLGHTAQVAVRREMACRYPLD
eukprot:2386309-Prymnesium_polylepis.2